MGSTLKELSAKFAAQQPQQVDQLTEEAPVLAAIPFEKASHGLWNMYEEVDEIQGAGWVEMNGPLPAVDVSGNLRKVDLSILGGEIECPEDTARLFGGKESYFSRKMPKVLRKSGMSAEERILYDNFRAYALKNKTALNCGSGVDGCYSILAVRFISGETCGLYSPECFVRGTLLDSASINGGELYKAPSGKHQGILVYGMRLKAYLGLQIAGRNSVAALVNINAQNQPTETMIDDLLASVRAASGTTYLFMHEKVRNMLFRYKQTALHIAPDSRELDRRISHWNGIEIITSYNFKDGTEKKAVL